MGDDVIYEYTEVTNGIRSVIEPMFDLFAPLVPAWCETITIRYRPASVENDGRIADTLVMKNYRTATITIFGPFFAKTPAYQLETILHELLHIPESRFHEVATEACGGIADDWAREQQQRLIGYEREAMLDDIAYGILRLLKAQEDE